MSRILEASCIGGVVKVGAIPVTGVTILSQGVGPSEGVLLMQGEELYYVAKTSPDLEETLTGVIDALTEIASALTALGAGIPLVTTPPTLGASVSTITAKVAELAALKELLK
jgi:hypothetical protein